MHAHKVSAVMAAVLAAAAGALTAAPSQAQTAAPEVRPGPVRAAVVVRPPARVTVRKRSYLDPGTETKRRAELLSRPHAVPHLSRFGGVLPVGSGYRRRECRVGKANGSGRSLPSGRPKAGPVGPDR